jgi:hypothetical protein
MLGDTQSKDCILLSVSLLQLKQRPSAPSFRYGTLQFPERNIYCLAGFSDKALQTMRFLEEDKGALLREIEAIAL